MAFRVNVSKSVVFHSKSSIFPAKQSLLRLRLTHFLKNYLISWFPNNLLPLPPCQVSLCSILLLFHFNRFNWEKYYQCLVKTDIFDSFIKWTYRNKEISENKNVLCKYIYIYICYNYWWFWNNWHVVEYL